MGPLNLLGKFKRNCLLLRPTSKACTSLLSFLRIGIATNELLEVKGAPNVYAIGDCAAVEQKKVVEDFIKLFKDADANGDGKLSHEEFRKLLIDVAPKYRFFLVLYLLDKIVSLHFMQIRLMRPLQVLMRIKITSLA